LLTLIHTIAVWGYSGPFSGDNGRWLHEVDRLAQGEVLYRDFIWIFPPLPLWLLGAVGRVFGTTPAVIWVTTSLLCCLIVLAYARYVALLIPGRFYTLTVLAGVVLAFAAAKGRLPLGTYTPAAPIGFLFLLLGTLLTLDLDQAQQPRRAVSAGMLLGFAVLCKQDFWLPALYLVSVGILLPLARDSKDAVARRAAILRLAGFLGVILLGVSVIASQAGWSAVGRTAVGWGVAAETAGRGFPSWKRLTVEVWTLGVMGCVLVSGLRAGGTLTQGEFRRWITGLGILALVAALVYTKAESLGPSPLMAATSGSAAMPIGTYRMGRQLMEGFQGHLIPIIATSALGLAVAARWKREGSQRQLLLLILLGLCLAARSKRLFEHVEWFSILLETPVYVLALAEFLPHFEGRPHRGVVAALLTLLGVGLLAYHNQAKGSLTARVYPRVQTPRGVIRLPPNERREYAQLRAILDTADPSMQRPLFAFGRTGGYNYFLGRPNPTPLTHGFYISNAHPDEVVASLRETAPLVVDVAAERFEEGSRPKPGIFLTRWEAPTVTSYLLRKDRPFFDQVIQGCVRLGQVPPNKERALYTVYDCRRAGTAQAGLVEKRSGR
jgi:hypothetical protein